MDIKVKEIIVSSCTIGYVFLLQDFFYNLNFISFILIFLILIFIYLSGMQVLKRNDYIMYLLEFGLSFFLGLLFSFFSLIISHLIN